MINEQYKELFTNKVNEKLQDLLTKDFEDLSNNEMAWLKCVSLSSIMTMKKNGYDNETIMTTFGCHGQDRAQQVKSRIKHMSDEDLEALGLKRI